MNIENLTKLRDHLKSLPSDYQGFDMGDWYEKTTCGTVSCVLGHLPDALGDDVVMHGTSYKPAGYSSWEEYAIDILDIDPDSKLGDWLFNGSWIYYDNTLKGAILRIEYVLENGTYHPKFEIGFGVSTNIQIMKELYNG